MIVKADDFDRFLTRPADGVFIFLFYGTDPGLVHERAKQTVKKFVADPKDAFQLVRFSGDEIASNPGLLADEAATIGLFGDERAIWIEAGGKSFQSALEHQLANPPQHCKIIVEAGNLKPTAPLRKLLEPSRSALCLGCYADGPRELQALVISTLQAQGLSISAPVCDHLVSILGNDRLVTRSELDKLCLYARGESEVTLQHIDSIMNDAAASALDEAIDAAFAGQRELIEPACERVFRDGADPAYLLASSLAHAMRLHRMKLELDHGGQLDTILTRNGINFTRKRKVQAYMTKWSAAALQAAVDALQEAVMKARLQSNLGKSLVTRALWKVSALAASSRYQR